MENNNKLDVVEIIYNIFSYTIQLVFFCGILAAGIMFAAVTISDCHNTYEMIFLIDTVIFCVGIALTICGLLFISCDGSPIAEIIGAIGLIMVAVSLIAFVIILIVMIMIFLGRSIK